MDVNNMLAHLYNHLNVYTYVLTWAQTYTYNYKYAYICIDTNIFIQTEKCLKQQTHTQTDTQPDKCVCCWFEKQRSMARPWLWTKNEQIIDTHIHTQP